MRRILVLQIFPHADLRREPRGILNRRDARDEQRIRPEPLHALLDLAIQSVDDRGDRDHRCHADHDSEDGQAGTHLAGAQRIERHRQIFEDSCRVILSPF
jgi:hypothetical protein